MRSQYKAGTTSVRGHESVDATLTFCGHLYPEHLHAAVEGVFCAETSRVA